MIEIGKGSTMSFELILQGLDLLKNGLFILYNIKYNEKNFKKLRI